MVFYVGKGEKFVDVVGFVFSLMFGVLCGLCMLSMEVDFKCVYYCYGVIFDGGMLVLGISDELGFVWLWFLLGNVLVWVVDEDISGNFGMLVLKIIMVDGMILISLMLIVKVNYIDFNIVNYSEVYLYGCDVFGVVVDVDGLILVNGVMRMVLKGLLYMNFGLMVGYIVWESSGVGMFSGFGLVNFVMV